MKKLSFYAMMLGCDPEFFFRKGSDVVGADKILPRSGLGETGNMIIIDGVQAELNPAPSTCREVLAGNISALFQSLREHMKSYKGVSIDFSQTIKLSDGDFDRLSDDSKKFGCMPSKNANNGGKDGKIKVNPATYRFRSAGGHIHIGTAGEYPEVGNVLADPVRLVKMLDILVGNTCVLIDRDPGNIERRKVYGKAGEFRTPPHGVEYRTLSNFWLRDYALMSLVMGLTRQAVIICANNMDDDFVKLVDMDDIARAINTNNFTLALRNFKRIQDLLLDVTPTGEANAYGAYPIDSENIQLFRHFVKKGLDYWFKESPVDHWADLNYAEQRVGFFDFLDSVVRRDINK